MRAIRSFLAVALALTAATVSAQTRPPAAQVRPPAGETVQWVYLAAPPEVVTGTLVERIAWSPDGRYALAVRQKVTLRDLDDIQMEPSIVLWNAEKNASTVVWKVASSDYHVGDVAWMRGTSVALVTVAARGPAGHRNTIWRIDARRATAVEVAPARPAMEDGTGIDQQVSLSPRLPWAVVYGLDEQGTYLQALGADGQLARTIRPAGAQPALLGWSKDGATAYLAGQQKTRSGTDPGPPGWVSFRPDTMEIGSITTEPDMAQPDPPRSFPFTIEGTTTDLSGASKATAAVAPWNESRLRSLWLVQGSGKETERVLLAADAFQYEISPRGDAVLYANREGCFVAPLIRLDRARMEEARQAARRAELMSNGKQVGLAVMMYAMDNDENLPPEGTDLRTLLQPYVRSQDVFNGLTGPGDGFVYTFGGGPMSSVENPANTRMGFIPAPGGQVIVYMDGHVTFEPAGTGTTPP